MKLTCPGCRRTLIETLSCTLECPQCHSHFPVENGIADFSRGAYYDDFDPTHILTQRDHEGLGFELAGARRRIIDYYEPILRRDGHAHRVLDSGCGNGVSVDLLNELGYEAWGNDLSALRKYQWRERRFRERFVVASSLHLPFPTAYFDAIISSGVVEHIGVLESATPRYSVRPLPDRDDQRRAFLSELVRIAAPGGRLFLDCPNGAFPIDFWHGDTPGAARRHARTEGFLPTFGELRQIVCAAAPRARVIPLSPFKRLQFHQARRHAYGRVLAPLVETAFRAMTLPGIQALAATRLNPFLVICVQLPDESPPRLQSQ